MNDKLSSKVREKSKVFLLLEIHTKQDTFACVYIRWYSTYYCIYLLQMYDVNRAFNSLFQLLLNAVQ